MLLVRLQEGHSSCKKTEWLSTGMVICLQQGADLHMAQLMPLPLTVFCFSKIQIVYTFLVPAHPVDPDRGLLNVCVCVCDSGIHFAVMTLLWASSLFISSAPVIGITVA